MKQKIVTSLLGFSLLLLGMPASAHTDTFFFRQKVELIRNRVEQRDAQVRDRLCGRYMQLELSLPAWCSAPVPPPIPPPAGGVDHLLITEVYYDVDTEHGTESANEWVEIYNGTGSEVDLSNWMIADTANSDLLPEGTILPDNSFAIITNDASTAALWGLSEGTLLVTLGNTIGSNGLSNEGDAVMLKNPADETVDAVSWGTNIGAFNPSVLDVADGHSIMRLDIFSDTNTAADWTDAEFPGPGGAG